MDPARTGTGPPEAPAARGEEPAPSPWPPPAALVWAFGAGLLVVLVAAVVVSFWAAGLVLAGLLAVLAVLHVVLPISSLGPLAVRTPWVDAATCAALATCLAVLALVAPRGPGG